MPQLEETLKDKLDRAGDDEAAETVAAFEVKYNRLKERYKVCTQAGCTGLRSRYIVASPWGFATPRDLADWLTCSL